MTLLKISLYTAPLALFGLTGCGPKECDTGTDCDTDTDTDADTDTDTDADTDTDTDTDADADTAVAYVFYAGDAQTSGGNFTGGHFGYAVYNAAGDDICDDLSVWSDAGTPAPGGCPDCDWSFTLDLADGTAEGPSCGNMLPSALVGGEWDGFTGSWGFAETYDYYYAGTGTTYSFDTALFYYSVYTGYEGWFMLSGNYAGSGYNSGNAESFTFMQYAGYMYYYP